MSMLMSSQSMQHHRCPLMKRFPRLRMQGKLASAIANLTPQVLNHHVPGAQSATALQEPSVVLLPRVNHPSLESQYHLVRLCTVIAIMTGHQGLRAAGAAELCRALQAVRTKYSFCHFCGINCSLSSDTSAAAAARNNGRNT